jgi:hypothetical protein
VGSWHGATRIGNLQWSRVMSQCLSHIICEISTVKLKEGGNVLLTVTFSSGRYWPRISHRRQLLIHGTITNMLSIDPHHHRRGNLSISRKSQNRCRRLLQGNHSICLILSVSFAHHRNPSRNPPPCQRLHPALARHPSSLAQNKNQATDSFLAHLQLLVKAVVRST